ERPRPTARLARRPARIGGAAGLARIVDAALAARAMPVAHAGDAASTVRMAHLTGRRAIHARLAAMPIDGARRARVVVAVLAGLAIVVGIAVLADTIDAGALDVLVRVRANA